MPNLILIFRPQKYRTNFVTIQQTSKNRFFFVLYVLCMHDRSSSITTALYEKRFQFVRLKSYGNDIMLGMVPGCYKNRYRLQISTVTVYVACHGAEINLCPLLYKCMQFRKFYNVSDQTRSGLYATNHCYKMCTSLHLVCSEIMILRREIVNTFCAPT